MIHKTFEEIQKEFHPTMGLRWVSQYMSEKKILEQQFVNNLGEVEWREIPTV